MLSFILVIASSTCALPAPAPSDGPKKAKEWLQGTWVCVGVEEKGKKATAEVVKEEDFSMTIKGDELTLRHGEGQPGRYSFTLDPDKKPAHIDLKELGGEVSPATIHAIYSLDKGELKICFGSNLAPDEPEVRPREFATASGSEHRPPKGKVLLTFQKEKK